MSSRCFRYSSFYLYEICMNFNFLPDIQEKETLQETAALNLLNVSFITSTRCIDKVSLSDVIQYHEPTIRPRTIRLRTIHPRTICPNWSSKGQVRVPSSGYVRLGQHRIGQYLKIKKLDELSVGEFSLGEQSCLPKIYNST